MLFMFSVPTGVVVLQVKGVKPDPHRHAVWNRNRISTVHVIWIGVRISGTLQDVVCNATTGLMGKERKIKLLSEINFLRNTS